MVSYSITDLEKITGIKAHTIRIWEKRYKVFNPKRTATNIRCYTDDDLKLLMNISLLNRYGLRISNIVTMSQEELNQKVMDITENTSSHNMMIEQMIVAMMEFNEDKFEKVLTNSLIKSNFEQTVTNVIYPFLERIGILWLVGTITPAQEHFIVNLIRQKIIAAIDGLIETPGNDAKKFLLFLPAGEFHELSLLFYWYNLKKMGHKVIYLGQSLPVNNLKLFSKVQQPDYIITVLTNALNLEQYESLISTFANDFSKQTVLISGLQIKEHTIDLPSNISILECPDDLYNILNCKN
ncbi:MAG: MerR family transcriptional regulator [Bacteroidales bacterium]|jgi:DNA-binding transcriptional MerR regulator|nr:MerR family transcriptional regulator [Bacteroidales bacterium]